MIQLNALTKTATTTLTMIIVIYVALLKDGLLKIKVLLKIRQKKPQKKHLEGDKGETTLAIGEGGETLLF